MNIDNQKFQEYIEAREKRKQQMAIKYDELKHVTMPFGKYKGQRISMIQDIEDGRHGKVGKQYLRWVMNNVEIENDIVREAVKFYESYFYLPGDGYD